MHPTPARPYDGTPDREIESPSEFDGVVSTRGALSHFRVRAVDLTERTDVRAAVETEGAVLLGCPGEAAAATKARTPDALVLPPAPGLPFDPVPRFRPHARRVVRLMARGTDAYAGVRVPAGHRRDRAGDLRQRDVRPPRVAERAGADGSRGPGAPAERLPARPLLRKPAEGRSMRGRIAPVGRIGEAPAALKRLSG